MIGIVAALSFELDGIRRKIRVESHAQMGAYALWEGRCEGHRVVLVQTGVGRARAEEATDLLLARYPLSVLLSIGFGGGVHPELECGDVVVCPTVRRAAGGEVPSEWLLEDEVHSDARLQRLATEALAEEGIRGHVGDSLAVSRVIGAPALKAEIGHTFHVKVVDMESYWVAHRAVDRVSSLLVARAISDPLDCSLPDFASVVDADWSDGPRRIISQLVRRPSLLPSVAGLALCVRKAARSLAAFVPALVRRI